ncbi:uncharacterized protein LOC114262930 isoform X1 [Camellia sinensis]|uniref:uncharacterized protein LOC114262930 isoform X1 n=1 Tax=Camellia sinensis TaxID=4442 RepID=UPI001035DC79|nr:uncharacterized protein LOC114262930 isoform X1 [Camellia sinensis]
MGVHVVSSADLGSGSDGGGQVIPEPVQKKTWASVVTSNQKASVKLSGFIGIVECAFIYEPLTDNEFDKEAASRALAFDLACFMQLDLGQLQVRNEFSWHGCPEKDPSAVHLDVLDAEILGINMAIGIIGCIGKPMIRDGQGINVYVRRSLRDVFWKVPTFSLGVKVFSVTGDLLLSLPFILLPSFGFSNLYDLGHLHGYMGFYFVPWHGLLSLTSHVHILARNARTSI